VGADRKIFNSFDPVENQKLIGAKDRMAKDTESESSKEKCLHTAEFALSVLKDSVRELNVAEVATSINRRFNVNLSEGAVRSALQQLKKKGKAATSMPSYDEHYGKQVFHWMVVPDFEKKEVRAKAGEIIALKARVTESDRRLRTTSELLSKAVELQRKKFPPYTPETEAWLRTSDEVLAKNSEILGASK
jgi:hypothetical protein